MRGLAVRCLVGTLLALVCVARSNAQSAPGVFNVLDYGARGDGSGDDYPAIAAALAAAAPGRGTVMLPPGTYAISNPLRPAVDVTIAGAGSRSSFLTPSSLYPFGNSPLIRIENGSDRVRVLDLGFVGGVTGFKGIEVLGAKDAHVEHCWFDGGFWWSVYFGESARYGRVTDIISEGSRGHNVEVNDSSYCVIADSHLKNASGNGIEVYQRTTGEAVGNKIARNTIEGSHNAGIALLGDEQTLVIENTIMGASGNGIRGRYSEVQGPAVPSAGALIIGNLLDANGGSSENGIQLDLGTVAWNVRGNSVKRSGNCGIAIVGGTNHVIDGNTAIANQGHGIYVSTGSGHVISSNTAVDNSQVAPYARDGIRVEAAGNTLTANRAGSSGVTIQQGYGILLVPSATGNTLIGNITSGNRYAGLVDLAAGNTSVGNR